MSSVTQRIERILGREASTAGIRPVAGDERQLGGLDAAVLWFDLSIGLLVMVTGALLVPALGPPRALLAIAVGTAIGCVPLALVALAGQREGVPTMVLLRPVLGERGSFLPSAINVVQLVGWTAVEFWAMGEVANVASSQLFGFDSRAFWIAVVAVVCTALALGGPIFVVRRWLQRFGIYVLLGSAVWITFEVLRAGSGWAIWETPGSGGLPFWLAVDLVIVMPISWLPLAADYSRFARPGSRAGIGTYAGYAIGNAWFYALGALLVLVTGAGASAVGIGGSIVFLAGGGLVLLALLVGESDNAFADIYSAAVSARNVAPSARQAPLVLLAGAVGLVLALAFTVERYEVFLFLIGSVFVPLAAVLLADYFVCNHGRFGEAKLFERSGVRWRAFVPWVAGFVVYQWSVPTGPEGWVDALGEFFGALGLPFPLLDSRLGASIPSFVVAFGLAALLPRAPTRSPRAERAAGPRPGARPTDPRSRS